jgi:uncharacterized protein (DUF2252 family)
VRQERLKHRKNEEVTIEQAIESYEKWMRSCATVFTSDVQSKHEQMQESHSCFCGVRSIGGPNSGRPFALIFCSAPKILAVGDLHVNSFGTWRDAEGRLCWGVDDFDESYPLPYTNDLVRLAASMKIVIDAEGLSVKLKDGCDAILEGYRQSLKKGGYPIVLEEQEQKLGKLGVDSFKPPTGFWEKLNRLPTIRTPRPPDVKHALETTLPDSRME